MNLDIHHLTFSYRKHPVFQDFQLEIEEGINVLLGANGSGKTTLFKILTTILEPKEGEITLNNIKLGDKNYRRYISYIPQSFNVYPGVRVREFLKHIGQVKYGYQGDKMEQEIQRVAEQADIGEFLDKKMKELSEGMRKRVGIAQAIIGDAVLIIADEPTAGLDPEQRNKFNLTLKRINKGRIVLVSTHIIEDIRAFYDNIITLSEGKITFQGSYEQLIHSLDGKIFQTTIGIEELDTFQRKHHILSKEYMEEKVAIKAVMEQPEGNAEPVEPSLTDIWTYYK